MWNNVHSCTDKVAAEKSDIYTTILKWHTIKKQNRALGSAASDIKASDLWSKDKKVPCCLSDHTSTTKHVHCCT